MLLIISAHNAAAIKELKIVHSIDLPLSNQSQPSIFEDTIVFLDDAHGNYDIFAYNLVNQNLTQITSDPHQQRNPHIQASRIVWEDKRNGNWDIYLYNIYQALEIQISNDSANQVNPFIFGNYIAWQDDRNSDWDIYIYDIITQRERRITNSSADEVSPLMSRNRMDIELVWIDRGLSEWEDSEVFKLRLTTFDESLENITQVTDDQYDQAHIAASLDNVIYSCNRDNSYNIYIYNYEIETEDQITCDVIDQKYPAFDMEQIVWIDKRTKNDEVYQFNMILQEQYQLTNSKTIKSDVQIYYNWVAWVETEEGDKDIHYLDLTQNPPEKLESINPQPFIGILLIFGAAYLLVKTFKKPRSGYVPTIAEINKLSTKDDLTGMCNKLGLSTKGDKKRLRRRLLHFIESEQSIHNEESEGGKKMKLKLKGHSSKPDKKITESGAKEPEGLDVDEFDIDIEETFTESENAGTKFEQMDEAIYEIKEGLAEQKGELQVLRNELKSLKGAAVKESKKVKFKRLRPVLSESEEEMVLRIVDITYNNLPREVTDKFSGSDYYLLYEKVLREYRRRDS